MTWDLISQNNCTTVTEYIIFSCFPGSMVLHLYGAMSNFKSQPLRQRINSHKTKSMWTKARAHKSQLTEQPSQNHLSQPLSATCPEYAAFCIFPFTKLTQADDMQSKLQK